MDKKIKSAVALSIISSPSKNVAPYINEEHPDVILGKLDISGLKPVDYISARFSSDINISAERIIDACVKKNISIITLWDSNYPQLLKEIHNPPVVLYVTGNFENRNMISIVGTRDSDERSDSIASGIASAASKAGYIVVSGMASGIDRSVHIGALKSGGDTIAVLPGGVDRIYPAKNSDIYRMIIESDGSAVISELPPGAVSAEKWTFAKRNRIISGLSEVVVVVQAPVKSGAMITAGYAIEQNRRLLACPGNAFDEKYHGCNNLIKQGAELFHDFDDLFPDRLFCKNIAAPDNNNPYKCIETCDKGTTKAESSGIPETLTGKIERDIYSRLVSGPVDIDTYIRENRLDTEEVNRGVTMLEISGYAARRGGRIFMI